ncbi:MAG: CopD family protein [Chloroflexi bacterium]|nr:CopD family protein [Chloroflexota bacterium]
MLWGEDMATLVVFLHIVAAMVWIGGMLFISLVLVPLVRHLPPGAGPQLLRITGRRFRLVAWPAIGVLVATGVLNAWHHGAFTLLDNGLLWQTSWGRWLTVKVGLVALAVVMSLLHDWVLGPHAGALEMAARRGNPQQPDAALLARAAAIRRATSWLARLNGVIALTIVLLGVFLSRG